ncbi:MAG: ATP synthase subunit I [Desulfomonilaceae bacterium]
MDFQKIPRIWFSLSGILFVLGILGCAFFTRSQFLVGFLTGGMLTLLNSWISARKIEGSDFYNRGRVLVSLLGGFYFRLFLIGICLFVLIRFVKVDPLGLIIGLSVVPAGLFVMLMLIHISNRRPKEV